MEIFYICVHLLVELLLSAICVAPSLAFPPKYYVHDVQHVSSEKPWVKGSSRYNVQEQLKAPAEERKQVNTIKVTCHPDSLEIVIKADMFRIGAPVNGDDIRLGVEHDAVCRAAASSGDEYRIVVGLGDCGNKHWIYETVLAYTNLLIYSPVAAPDGVIRMDEAVIPIECYYRRKYSLSSSSLMPTWIPFTSNQAVVETLDFDLRTMTGDWLSEKSSNVFYLGEPIRIEASVKVGHHMGLRVFLSSCVATLQPDMDSVPRYVFIENGCLVDSQFPGSKSYYLHRTQDDKLHFVIDAFRFHNEDKGELYITCRLNAVPVNDAEAPNKACTFVNGRWQSADGNDYLCGHCRGQNEAGQTRRKSSSHDMFGPRGYGKPEPETFWKSGLKKVWEQEAKVGPMLVLSAKHKSGPQPAEEFPPVLHKTSRPAQYGSHWRGGVHDDLENELLPSPPTTPDQVEVQTSEEGGVNGEMDLEDDYAESEGAAHLEKLSPEFSYKNGHLKMAALDNNGTEALGDVGPTDQSMVDVTMLPNATTTEPAPSFTNEPKK